MANALYGLGRNAFLTKAIDWVNDTIRVYLIDVADYSVNIDVDQYLDDIGAAAKVAFASLASKTASLGVADAADTTLSAVTGDTSEALVIAMWSGVESSSPLIAYIDTATGLPVIPNGGDITITWDNGANKIFKL